MNSFIKNTTKKTFARDAIAVTFIVYLGCAVSGPFGTFTDMNLLQRLGFWAPLVLLALITGAACCETIWRWTSKRDPVQRGVTTALVFTAVYAPLIYGIAWTQVLGNGPVKSSFLEILFFVFVFATILTGYILYAEVTRRMQPTAKPRLYARLPDVGESCIKRLSVKDHYVHVHMSDQSEHRILMRFADAVNEMDGTQGFYTHRSHWVSRDCIREAVRRGAKEFVVLDCGALVPVSKTHRENVVSAGLI